MIPSDDPHDSMPCWELRHDRDGRPRVVSLGDDPKPEPRWPIYVAAAVVVSAVVIVALV